MANDDPVFQSVGQALHVSYLITTLPVTQRVSTQILIDSIRQQLGKTEARISSTINLGGLSPLEFRGQCALVIAAVNHHLTEPEQAAVRARYAWDRMVKSGAVRYLADYIQPATGIEHEWAVRGVVWSQYHRGSQRAKDRWSLADISKETGVPVSALRRCLQMVREQGEGLERRAEARLGELFTRTKLVADLSTERTMA